MAHVHSADCSHGDMMDITAVRTMLLKEAFGEKNVAECESILEQQAKANYDAYAFKVKATAPVFAARSALIKKLPAEFWLKSLSSCQQLAALIDAVDRPALAFLEDVSIVHAEDPRDFTITFTFSPKNPFFSNTVLSKVYTVKPPAGDVVAKAPAPYDLEADLFHAACKIDWTSPAHDLTKKAPRVQIEELEEYDEFTGLGSLFNLFIESGEDTFGLGEGWLEWYSNALQYASGMVDLDGDDDEDEEESDDEGPGEIDLVSEEEEEVPKKKKAKRA